MRSFSKLEEAILLQLWDIGAIKFGQFKLKLHERNPEAPLSPIYLNLRDADNPKPGPLTKADYRLCALAMHDLASKLGLTYDFLCGIPNAGEPFAKTFTELVFDNSDLHLVGLKKVEEVGFRKVIADRNYHKTVAGKRVLVFDDLISQADTKIEAVQALRGDFVQGIVEDMIVLFDRCQGGVAIMKRNGVDIRSVFTLHEALDFYQSRGLITSEMNTKVRDYLAAQSV